MLPTLSDLKVNYLKIIQFLRENYSNPISILAKIISLNPINRIIPDKLYLYISYRAFTSLTLNFNAPKRFTEKLQYLKLSKEIEGYAKLADKYAVREFVTQEVGEKYLIPLIKVYNSATDIDFNELPNQFVLKCNHDSGTVIVCKDKSAIDKAKIKKLLDRKMKLNYFYIHRESQYKHIKPRIICETFLSSEDNNVPPDYKFFCFNGKPKYIQVDLNRFENHNRIIYTTYWTKAPFSIKFYNSSVDVAKPDNLDEMLSVAKKLSRGLKFVRVDLYSVRNKVYFGELTLFHGSGYEPFFPDEYDYEWGTYIDINTQFKASF